MTDVRRGQSATTERDDGDVTSHSRVTPLVTEMTRVVIHLAIRSTLVEVRVHLSYM